jgi:hypothetical protein
MGIPEELILTGDDLGIEDADLAETFGESTPLWFYILREASVRCDGTKLGPVGGRIVAEVLIGLLHGDPLSYLSVQPNWKPEPDQFGARADGTFGMAELLSFAATPVPHLGPTFAALEAANPNISQQYQDWRDLRILRGEDPIDYHAFRRHLIAIGAPDPGVETIADFPRA